MRHRVLRALERLMHIALQVKGLATFGLRVGILGDFTVMNPQNVQIGHTCSFNYEVFVLGHTSVEILNYAVFSARCILVDAGLNAGEFVAKDQPRHVDGPIRIEDGAWIGAGAIILPGVTVGRKAIVRLGSVVTRNVEPLTVVAAKPAKVTGRLT